MHLGVINNFKIAKGSQETSLYILAYKLSINGHEVVYRDIVKHYTTTIITNINSEEYYWDYSYEQPWRDNSDAENS